MNNLIVFNDKVRLAVSAIKEEDLVKKFTVLLSVCAQIKGIEFGKSQLLFASKQLAEVFRSDFKDYDFSEVEQILKKGFVKYGMEYPNVSVSACMDIMRRFNDNQLNRDKLQQAIHTSTEFENGEMTEGERITAKRKHQYLAFERAKEKYEKNKVTRKSIYYCFSECYNHVKENLKDNSIDISIEKRREIWNKVRKIYENQNNGNRHLSENKKVFAEGLLEIVPKQIMLEIMLKSVLFHIWAMKNIMNSPLGYDAILSEISQETKNQHTS